MAGEYAEFLLFLCFLVPSAAKPVNKSAIVIQNKELLPQDHIPGVKLERDGHINPVFHHEAFLGRLVDQGKLALDHVGGSKKLIKIFHKVDTNNNHKIDEQELTQWIHERIMEHYEHASKVNKEKFNKVDKDGDGMLNLTEFLEGLTKKDGKIDDALVHDLVNDKLSADRIESIMEDLLPDELERWKKADMNEDTKLSLDEFLSFQHPEHNERSIKAMAEDLVRQMDDNRDMKLAIDEFVRVPPGEVVDPVEKAEDEKYFKERTAEFKDKIDLDKDGFISLEELTKYLDPRHKQHAVKEAEYLMGAGDANHDGELDEEEMLLNYELFTGSTLTGNPQVMHDEF